MEAGNVNHLSVMDVSNNKLSGEIPSTLGKFESLEYLDMHTNLFHGTIPSTFSSLKSIQFIDLFQAFKISREIPIFTTSKSITQ